MLEAVAGEEERLTVDLSGGSGYTQIYLVMQPAPGVTSKTTRNGLVPRAGLFRFGDWVYAGVVEFPVDALRLGDVPHVLPALQKQQGRLGFLSESKAFPVTHPLTPTVQAFMGAVALLRHEMEDSQEEVAALAEQSMNAWIDADWAASFFELAFQGGAIPEGLRDVEVVAAKIYLHGGSGIVLHVVYFQGSMYCVLSESVEDLPLLDVAFPDVTARNRAVQVRTYSDTTARKLAAAFAPPGVCPLPKCLRVWEGRRKGVAGVGTGAGGALADGGDVAAAIRERARLRAEAEATAAAASSSSGGGGGGGAAGGAARGATAAAAAAAAPAAAAAAPAAAAPAAAAVAAAPVAAAAARTAAAAAPSTSSSAAGGGDSKYAEDDDIYDMSGVKAVLPASGGGGGGGGGGAPVVLPAVAAWRRPSQRRRRWRRA